MRTPSTATLSTTELFCKAAERLSSTDAAKALGATPSAISKAVRRLEDRLGIALFLRITRSIRLTEDGRVHYEACRQALVQIEQSEKALREGRSDPLVFGGARDLSVIETPQLFVDAIDDFPGTPQTPVVYRGSPA